MINKSHSFNIQNINYDEIQKKIEDFLKKRLLFSVYSKRLGDSLIRINYIDNNIDIEMQKDNRITILQEPGKRIYIQIHGKLMDTQIIEFWKEIVNILDKPIKHSDQIEQQPSKDEIIQKIKKKIEEKGCIIKKEEIETFVNNFIEKYNRLPNKDEFNSIANGYTIIFKEEKSTEIKISEELMEIYDSNITETHTSTSQNDSFYDSNQNRVIIMEGKKNNSILNVKKVEGRRKCPKCGNVYNLSIYESVDKGNVILDYPRLYGKKYRCGECGVEWREK